MKFRHIVILSFTLAILAGCGSSVQISQNGLVNSAKAIVQNQPTRPTEATTSGALVNDGIEAASSTQQPTRPPAPAPTPTPPVDLVLPSVVNWPVAFASQAPFGNWDALHEESCEEAAMIMAVKYFKKLPLSPHIMEQEILDLVKWETDKGYQVDVNAHETVNILKVYFDQPAIIISDISVVNIKKQLDEGKLILVPAAGRLLGNPNFTGLGPIYHMLVIRGYDNNTGEFITNDPGTRKGEGYRYRYQTLINAIHDWNHDYDADGITAEEMEQGQKVLIVVSK